MLRGRCSVCEVLTGMSCGMSMSCGISKSCAQSRLSTNLSLTHAHTHTCRLRDTPSLSPVSYATLPTSAPPTVAEDDWHMRGTGSSACHASHSGALRISAAKTALKSQLLIGQGNSVWSNMCVAHVTWSSQQLHLKDGSVYKNVPHTDDGTSDHMLVCELQHDSTIARVPDDTGSPRRSPALLLSWGPKDDKHRLFLAGRDGAVVLEWYIQVSRVIELRVAQLYQQTQHKMHLYHARKQARQSFRLIRRAEDFELKHLRAEQAHSDATDTHSFMEARHHGVHHVEQHMHLVPNPPHTYTCNTLQPHASSTQPATHMHTPSQIHTNTHQHTHKDKQ